MAATSQLRIYTVRPGQMDAFVELWRTKIVPARLRHGFRIDGAWRDDRQDRFAWVVTWEGEEPWEAKDGAYYASPERAAIDPDPSVFLATVDTSIVRAVPLGD